MLALNEILERDGETAANIIDAEGKISKKDTKNTSLTLLCHL